MVWRAWEEHKADTCSVDVSQRGIWRLESELSACWRGEYALESGIVYICPIHLTVNLIKGEYDRKGMMSEIMSQCEEQSNRERTRGRSNSSNKMKTNEVRNSGNARNAGGSNITTNEARSEYTADFKAFETDHPNSSQYLTLTLTLSLTLTLEALRAIKRLRILTALLEAERGLGASAETLDSIETNGTPLHYAQARGLGSGSGLVRVREWDSCPLFPGTRA